MKDLRTTVAAALLAVFAGAAGASDFDLDGLDLPGLEGLETFSAIKAAPPSARPVTIPADELIGVSAEVRAPFAAVKRGVEQVARTERRIRITDPLLPVVSRAGEFLRISNIHIDANGIQVDPVITIRPYLEGRNRLAIRIQRVQLRVEMRPDRTKAAALPELDQEQIMAQVMDVAIKGINKALDERLARHGLRAADVLALSYDKAAWTLRGTVKTGFLTRYLAPSLFAQPGVTAFGFDDRNLTLRVSTDR